MTVRSFLQKIFGSKVDQEHYLKSFFDRIGISPGDPSLYVQALTHGSFLQEAGLKNERLEFIGDAILGSIVSEWLYELYPDKKEGELSKLRSRIVSRNNLNQLGFELGIHEFLKHKISKTDFETTNNYIGNAFEALVGAVYFDKGYDFTRDYILNSLLRKYLDIQDIERTIKDFKSNLIIWSQKAKKDFYFQTLAVEAAEEPLFEAIFYLDGREVSRGTGKNKKTAEQRAAKKAMDKLNIREEDITW